MLLDLFLVILGFVALVLAPLFRGSALDGFDKLMVARGLRLLRLARALRLSRRFKARGEKRRRVPMGPGGEVTWTGNMLFVSYGYMDFGESEEGKVGQLLRLDPSHGEGSLDMLRCVDIVAHHRPRFEPWPACRKCRCAVVAWRDRALSVEAAFLG